jgi:hypothetical protein
LQEALIKVVAAVVEAVEVAIKAGANIEVEDAAIKVEEEVTIALVIGHHH